MLAGGHNLNMDHHYFSIGMNPSPREGELSVLFSGEGTPVSLHKMGPAVHDYYLIHTVLSGKGKFITHGKQYSCSTGDTFIIFPGELFSYEADEADPWRYVWFSYVGTGAHSLTASIGASHQRAVVSNSLSPAVRSYYYHIHDCFQTASNHELSNLEAEGWARLLLLEFGKANLRLSSIQPASDSVTDRLMKQAIQYLTLQFTQPISIEQMANSLGYHRGHLCKLFKQTTGLSPMQYLLKIRMERAENLLATSMTIEQVASSVGYNDALYFSRKFSSWNGQSPSEYRKALRGTRSATMTEAAVF